MKDPILVAELTINHLGMINIAKTMITEAKAAGADYVKLKKKNVKKYYDRKMDKWRSFDFLEYRESLELSDDDFHELNIFCKENEIPWFSSVHDSDSLAFVRQFDVPMYKIASMDSAKEEFLNEVIDVCKFENKPLVVSLGGKSELFANNLVNKIKQAKIDAHILHTVSIYPTPAGSSNINYMNYLIKKYSDERIKIGYSGHEEGISASILAGALGAKMIERHFTLSKDYKIHHIDAAITKAEFEQMATIIKEIKMEQDSVTEAFNSKELAFLEEKIYE